MRNRFCPHGHDKSIVGITQSYGCKECARQFSRLYSRKKDPNKRRAYQREHAREYRKRSDHYREYFTKYYYRVKEEFFEQYGAKCQGPTGTNDCIHGGVTDKDILTVAHMNNDGRAHRKAVGGAVILDLRKRGWPKDEGISVQCFNCQWKHRLLNLTRLRVESHE